MNTSYLSPLLIATIYIYCTLGADDVLTSGEFDHQQIPFEDIVICGTNETAFPFCGDPFQSPININTSATLSGRKVSCNSIPLDINIQQPVNNEYEVIKKDLTIQVNAEEVIVFNNPVIPLASTRDRVKTYCLEQLHFHWSEDPAVGGEHGIDGVRPPLEGHFVHYNCPRGSVGAVQEKYPTREVIDVARAEGFDVYELGVLSIDFEITEESNPAIDRILDAVTVIQEQERLNCTEVPEMTPCFDPNATSNNNPNIFKTLQRDIDFTEILTPEIIEGGYFTYDGSLTTPPCTSDVRWFIFNTLNHISFAQFLRWRDIFTPCNPDRRMAPNGRPLQDDLNPVVRCKGDGFVNKDKDDDNSAYSTFRNLLIK